jgi:hypothetical protein
MRTVCSPLGVVTVRTESVTLTNLPRREGGPAEDAADVALPLAAGAGDIAVVVSREGLSLLAQASENVETRISGVMCTMCIEDFVNILVMADHR